MTKRLFIIVSTITCLTVMSLVAQAQRTVTRSTRPATRSAILRLENRASLFRNSVEAWSRRNAGTSQGADDINALGRDFDDSIRRLRDRYDRRQAVAADARDVLNLASRIDDFVRRNDLDAITLNSWSSMRVDLNQLARAYNISWQQSPANYPPLGDRNNRDQYSTRALTGTYQFDAAHSEDVQMIADGATRDLAPSDRRRVRNLLTQRLNSPDQIAIDVRGRTVTLASTRAAQITFEADGRERVETMPGGRIIRSRASLNPNQLTVSSTGDAGNDFTVTFEPTDHQQLRVTRQVYVSGVSRAIVVHSAYQRTSDVARFDIYDPQRTSDYPNQVGSFVVPDGVEVIGVLDDSLSTRTNVTGDRFTLRVTVPAEFEGATIEGRVSQVQRSGRLTGRSLMTLDFDTIRLRDGRTYSFAGLLESVRTMNGEIVRVDTEGAVRDESQTTKTEERAAMGTAVGAIIGAIAGGGKGAAIGAILGAGGGAGSVYAEGRNDLDLGRGTRLTIRAGAPANTSR